MGTIINQFSDTDVLDAVGESYVGRLARVESQADMLSRYLVMRLRTFRGIRIEDGGAIARPDANGYILFHSSDDTVTIDDTPKPHAVNITVITPE